MEFLPNQKKYETDKKITVIFSVLDPKLPYFRLNPNQGAKSERYFFHLWEAVSPVPVGIFLF
jgi:hypothetical protein